VIPFVGTFIHAMDRKGRTNVPAKHREIMKLANATHLILIRGFDGCLFLLPPSTWEKFQARFEREEFQSEREARYFERLMLHDADVQKPDAQGRIQINQGLRDFASLEREVLIYGANTRIELWSPRLFQEYQASGKKSSGTIEELASSYFRHRD